MSSTRTVIIVDQALPKGLAANVTALLALSLGAAEPELPGDDVVDGDGRTHAGLFPAGLPILGAPRDGLATVHDRARERGLRVVAMPTVAHETTDYEAFRGAVAATPAEELQYVGVLVSGAKKAVSAVTGELALLR